MTNPASKFYIVSDLPERFSGTGVVYSTNAILPNNGTPLSLRTQTNNGFTTVDDSFDMFMFHIEGDGTVKNDRRLLVYVKNEGTGTVTIAPKQIIVTDGAQGTVHEIENTLGARALSETWDTKYTSISLAPGAGNVIAYSKRWDCSTNGTDTSTNGFAVGRVRAKVTNGNPGSNPTNLKVYIVNVAGGPIGENKTRAEAVLGQSVTQKELGLDLTTAPSGCEVRRANGVYLNKIWRNDPVTIDVDSLSSGGMSFQMALSNLMTQNCPAGRQTVDGLLYPGYAPPDNVGNYMVDYRVQMRVINKSSVNPRLFDLRFGKNGADVGLAYKVLVTNSTATDTEVDARPTRTVWAGPSQSATYKSMLALDGGPVLVGPCSERTVTVHFLVLGNSSLPFDMQVVPVDQSTFIVDNLDPGFSGVGSWTNSVSAGYYGTDSLVHAGTAGATGENCAVWRPNLFSAGSYKVYGWWVAGANRHTAAPYYINTVDGISQVNANQTTAGGQWNLLGTYNLRAGIGSSVALQDDVPTGKYVSADAIKFEFQAPLETVVDNTAATFTGSWGTSAGGGSYGTDARNHIGVAGGPDSVIWTPNLSRPGQYKVYAWWVASTNRAPQAPYEVYHRDGAALVMKDQRLSGSQWNLLGVYNFDQGTGGSVALSDEVGTSEYVSADAVKFVYVAPFEVVVDNRNPSAEVTGSWPQSTSYGYYDSDSLVKAGAAGANSVMFRPELPLMGRYDVYSWWVAGSNRSATVPYSIHHLDGDNDVVVNQKIRGSQWNYVGSYNFRGSADGYVSISDDVAGTDYVSADAVRFSYASPLEYEIDNTDPGATQTGTWTVSTAAGYHDTDSLTRATGTGTNTVRFQPNLPEIGRYSVYAWWVSGTDRTNASYSITNLNGTSTVTVDQTQNGGQWNYLGTYAFLSGTSGNATISDAGTAGKVVSADAVKFVYLEPFEAIVDNDDAGFAMTGTWATSTNAGYFGSDSRYHAGNAGADTASWTVPIPESGDYDVYAWWVAAANRATAAPFQIQHASGTASVTKDQTASGSQWVLLGRYTFSGGSNAVVTLNDNVPGAQLVSADAVRLVYAQPTASPKCLSITRLSTNPAHGSSVDFKVTFSKIVNGVDAADFSLSTSGAITGAAVTAVQNDGAGDSYTITVGTGSGDGTLGLDIAAGATIVDGASLSVSSAAPSPDETYTVDHNDTPTNISLSPATVNENVVLGTTVGTLNTTDPDTNDTFNYAFASPNFDAGGAFVIDGTTIKTNAALDYETQASYNVTVTSTDSAGASYTKSLAITINNLNENPQAEVIVDNGGSGYAEVGTGWTSSSNTVYYGSNSRYVAGGDGSKTATWTPTIVEAKKFNVYAWWVSSSNRSTTASYKVYHSNGVSTVTVNQTTAGGQWNLLGSYTMHPTGGCKVVLANNVATNLVVSADAVKFTPTGAPEFIIDNDGTSGYAEVGSWASSAGAGFYGTTSRWASTGDGTATATWTPPLSATGTYKVYAWWVASSNRAPNATFKVTHDGGTSNIAANETANGGTWNYLGTFTMSSGAKVVLPNTGQNGTVVSADAIKFTGQ